MLPHYIPPGVCSAVLFVSLLVMRSVRSLQRHAELTPKLNDFSVLWWPIINHGCKIVTSQVSHSFHINWFLALFLVKKHFTDLSPLGYHCGFMDFSFLNWNTILYNHSFWCSNYPQIWPGQWELSCWHLFITLAFWPNKTPQDHFFNNSHFLLLRNGSVRNQTMALGTLMLLGVAPVRPLQWMKPSIF